MLLKPTSIFIIIFGLLIGGWFIMQNKTIIILSESENNTESANISSIIIKNNPQQLLEVKQDILLNVPFTPQAPLANWSDIRQQNACEEASVLMAMRWVEGRDLPLVEAEKEIIAISDYELKTYGHFHDSSAQDTIERIFKGYFGYENVEIIRDISVEDIKIELSKGNLVIVPVNGQKLNNPFYTPPGPIEHMIVIMGYDAEAKEFITNDPGTKRGDESRYSEEILELALQDYPTGFHELINEVNKVMIVVKPNSKHALSYK